MGHLNNNQINDVLKETSIYLQTSLTEGIPNTLTRALKLSIPVVSTNAGGISEVFQTSDSGFLLEVGDINGIANAIIKLIENKDIRDKIRSKKNLLLQNKNSEINEYIKMYQDIA